MKSDAKLRSDLELLDGLDIFVELFSIINASHIDI